VSLAVVSGTPDTLAPSQIAAWIAAQLLTGGATARAASKPALAARRGPARVVWVERGDEVLVHPESVKVAIAGGALLVSVDLETDQTGRQPLIVTLSLGADGDGAGLVAVTDALPRGNAVLAARWGAALQTAVWSALLALARQHAAERATFPRGLALTKEGLHLVAGPPVSSP